MNRVILMGRLTRNPEIKYGGKDNDMAVARYTLAVNRRYKKDGEQEADFISCVVFGKGAEFAQKYLRKGMKVAILGRISTGSYKDKDGKTVYTTDQYMGIMAGIGTVLADDPMLNVRVEGWKSPVRIVCDSKLRIPPDSQIVKSAEKYRTIVAYADQKNTEEKIKILHTMGVETIYCPDEKNQIDLKKLMTDLGSKGIDSILLEGGGTLNDSALRAGIVKEVQAFVAPKLFGGVAGKTPVEGIGVEFPSEAVELKYTDICQIGEDIRIRCQVCEKKQEESCLQES